MRREVPAPPGHVARWVDAFRARKDYVCPRCDGRVAAGTGHVVAWPQELSDMRRHWHAHCWDLEVEGHR